jgi:hypothetical protein
MPQEENRQMKRFFPNNRKSEHQKRGLHTGKTKFVLPLLLGITLATSGCQVLTYSGAHGERLTRSSFGAKTSISSLSVESDTNGLRRVEMRGYQNDSVQGLGIVTEAAVRAALQSAKPIA